MQTFQISPIQDPKRQFAQLLKQIRATKGKKPTLEEITTEVGSARKARFEQTKKAL